MFLFLLFFLRAVRITQNLACRITHRQRCQFEFSRQNLNESFWEQEKKKTFGLANIHTDLHIRKQYLKKKKSKKVKMKNETEKNGLIETKRG